MSQIECYYTSHFINRTVIQFFSKGLDLPLSSVDKYIKSENVFASYGILRGTGDIIKEKNSKFIYLDHGYFNASFRKFTKEKRTILNDLGGYFRVIRDDLYFNINYSNKTTERFNKMQINLKEKKKGDLIIISEPTSNTLNFLEINNWTESTVNEIKKYTDREIIIHNKFSEIPLNSLLEKAFAFVSCQSTAGFYAITEGVPAYFTHKSLSRYGNIENIEKNELNYDLLYIAANSQWKLKEFFSDEFAEYINTINF